jgi:hypothetical protein
MCANARPPVTASCILALEQEGIMAFLMRRRSEAEQLYTEDRSLTRLVTAVFVLLAGDIAIALSMINSIG